MQRALKNNRPTQEEEREALQWATENLQFFADGKPILTKPPELTSVAESVPDAEKLSLNDGEINGLSSGLRDVDKMTRGLAKGEVIVLFGDTSHGKSQLAQNIALNVASQNRPVMFVGLEMTNTENTHRFLEMLERDSEKLMKLPIIYPKSNDIGYKDLDALFGAAVAEGAELGVIDHLHMLSRNVDNQANELSLISHEIKRIAVKYKIPILLISHINRDRDLKKPPTLANLKGSSSIEQDADICLAVFRDENGDGQTLEVWNRKNRNRGKRFFHAELKIKNSLRLLDDDF